MTPIINRWIKNFIKNQQQVRAYVAVAYANTIHILAKIRNQQGEIHLQALTSYKLGPQLQAAMTAREYFFGAAWHTLLKIDNKKKRMVYEESYVDPALNQDKIIFIPPEHIIFPEKIFGIPQTIWETFLGHLDHQDVVNLLNLKQHRHLWPAYQYALSATTTPLITARAALIGQFHFLLSVALYNPNDIKRQSMDVKNEYQFSVLNTIKHDLDYGEFNRKNMVKLHYCLTLLAVNKLRHCSNILDLCLLATMVSSYTKTALEPLDIKRKWGATNSLPFSDTTPHRFASALNLAKTIHKISTRPGILFFNSQPQWETYVNKETTPHLGKHYFDALFNDLIRRQIILQAHTANIYIDIDLLDIVRERFESLFIQDTAINKIEALQTYWQHNSQIIAPMIPSKNKERFWPPLIANTKINGIDIRPLASVDSVIKHGKTMQHCVEGDIFVDCCQNMNADILELVGEDGEMSTLDVRPNGKGGFYIVQHVGVGGRKKPSNPHIEAGLELLKEMQAGRIPLSKARQMTYLEKNSKPIYQFDYDLDDLTTQERIYQGYKSKKMLPQRLIFTNYLQMLEQTQLVSIINEVLQKMPSCRDQADRALCPK